MIVTHELDLGAFEAWSSAIETLNRIREEGKIADLEAILVDLHPDGIDETVLNDLLRFDSDMVYGWLGMKTDEELEQEDDREEDKDADDFDSFC